MKQLLAGLGVVALLAVAVVWSRPDAPRPEFDFRAEDKNPVTHTRFNNAPDTFQFAIVTDRTGGHRARVFSQAVEQLNLLQPEFVVSVGDLIEGYTRNKEQIAREWREFQTYASRLDMPFFYVPGNHDLTNPVMAKAWKDKFGRSYYHFTYKGVLFVALNSEDPPGRNYGSIGKDQQDWLADVLKKNQAARWTLVFLHKPMWLAPDAATSGFGDVEKLLKGRKYTVFAGHVHRYQKFVRQGMNYYMLATTGGDSKLRGVEYGEFDHVVWVTVKKDGPVLANVLLDGILREDLSPIVTAEEGSKHYFRRPTAPLEVTVTLDAAPVPGAEVAFIGIGKERGQVRADGISDEAGRVRLSSYEANDGIPEGEYAVTVTLRRPRFTPEGKPGKNFLPPAYADKATTPLKVKVPASGRKPIDLKLTKKAPAEGKK